jgi:hypothetical protein
MLHLLPQTKNRQRSINIFPQAKEKFIKIAKKRNMLDIFLQNSEKIKEK